MEESAISGNIPLKLPAGDYPRLASGEKIKEKASSVPRDELSIGMTANALEKADYFTKGNRVTPLVDGKEIMSAAKKMLKDAESMIQLEMYWLTNKELTDLLIEEKKKGIEVQVIIDDKPSNDPEKEKERKEIIKKLRANDVEVVAYPRDTSKDQIDHVKLLIVDGKSVLIGGMNWGNTSFNNRDVDVRIDGPVANYFESTFARDWKVSGGSPFTRPPEAKEIPGATDEVAGAGTDPSTNYFANKKVVMSNIEKAKRSIHVEMFALTDSDVINGLIDAHKRGLDVRVILDGTPYENGYLPNKKTFETLKKAGVPVKWFKPDAETKNKLHAKIGIFDGEKTVLGSCNWTKKGFYINRENDVDIKSKDTATVFEDMFERDWKDHATDDYSEIEPFFNSTEGNSTEWRIGLLKKDSSVE